jgi:Flp pilus assembly protein TadB
VTHETVYTLTAHATIVLTVIISHLVAWMREGRRHRWQQEENRQMRAAVDAMTVEVRNGKSH